MGNNLNLSNVKKNNKGQAVIEYLIALGLMATITFGAVNLIKTAFTDSISSLAHVISTHLSSGICERLCLFKGYKNGSEADFR